LRSSPGSQQVAHPHQGVDRQAEQEHPAHAIHAPMPGLAQQRHRLEPAEDLLDPLAPSLALSVAGVARGAPVDRAGAAAGVLGHVWRHAAPPQRPHERLRVVAAVRAQRAVGATGILSAGGLIVVLGGSGFYLTALGTTTLINSANVLFGTNLASFSNTASPVRGVFPNLAAIPTPYLLSPAPGGCGCDQ
jgi:hypothetical protein